MNLHSFLIGAVYLLIIAYICVVISTRAGLGSIIGLLLTGIVVGPYTPGPVLMDQLGLARDFTGLGVILLLFVIGLEMRPDRLWAMRRLVLGLGSLQVLTTGAFLAALYYLYTDRWTSSLIVGFTLAMSSTAFVMQLLQERAETASEHGRTAFAVLLLQDLAVVPLLALIPMMAPEPASTQYEPWWIDVLWVMGALGLLLGLGRYVLPFALRQTAREHDQETFFGVVLFAVFGSAILTEQVGLSMAFGAFLIGMLLSTSEYHYQIEATVHPFRNVAMNLFFIVVGMSIDLNVVQTYALTLVWAVPLILLIKAATLFGLALAFGQSRAVAIRSALLLAQCGEFGFVIFSTATASGLLHEGGLMLGLVVISISMVTTPFLVKLADRLDQRWKQSREPAYEAFSAAPETATQVMVGGCGPIGRNLCHVLHNAGIAYLAFDHDLSQVAASQHAGCHAYFGDITHPALWQSAHAEQASLVVLTPLDAALTQVAADHLRQNYPELPIIACALDLPAYDALRELQLSQVVALHEESSLQLGRAVLRQLGFGESEVEQTIETLRQDDYRLLRNAVPTQT